MNEACRQYCTFRVAKLWFGVDVQHVQEVIRYQVMTRVPLASKVISGLINLRGQIVTALDLRELMSLPARDQQRNPMNVVIHDDDDEVVSLLVDEIGDVIDVTADAFEPPPPTARASLGDLIVGSYKLPDRLLLVLNTTYALSACDARPNSESRITRRFNS